MNLRELFGIEAAADPAGAIPVGRVASRSPVVRSGTALELAELSWIAEGVSRELALSIPSVAACRNLVVGSIVQMGLYRDRGGSRIEPGTLLTKPDPSTVLPATLGGTVDDLLFAGRAYWRVLDRDGEGVPTRARWTPVSDVTPESRSTGGAYSQLSGYRVAGVDRVLRVEDVIRFDSCIPGVLDVGGRTLAAALELETAARRMAAVELPAGVLTNTGQELSQDELRERVEGFAAMRRELGVAGLQGWTYERSDLNAADLQLVEARANVATDVARLFNIPVAMIGASPSGNASALLYSNLSQQLAIMVSGACSPHLRTIESTLADVLPRGQSVAFDVQTFLRSDPQAAADYAIALLGAGIIDTAEARALVGIPSTREGVTNAPI